MKKHAQSAQLTKLLKQLRDSVDPEPPPERTPLEHLIFAFLAWNTTRNQAEQALGRLKRATVDLNDLRVTDPLEIAEILGARYSKAEERAQRLVLVLKQVYEVEHGMEMNTIAAMPKREARATLEQMQGMVPFVSASVLLLGLGAHAIPVDDQLVTRLKADGIVDEEATPEQVQSILEHHIRADEGRATHPLLRAYAERAVKVEVETGPEAKPAAGKTSSKKKTTSKAAKAPASKSTGGTAKKTKTAKKTTKKKTTKKKTSTRR